MEYLKKTLKIVLALSILSTIGPALGGSDLVPEKTPLEPGDTTFVWITIKNPIYGNWMGDTNIRLVPANNGTANAFDLLDDTASLGTIEGGEERAGKFKVHVKPDALEGVYEFDVYVTSTSKEGFTTTTKLEDKILSVKGIPRIILYKTSIGDIEPGTIKEITLNLKNSGTGMAKDVMLEINPTYQGATGKSPFSIVGSGTKFSLGTLYPDDEAIVKFNLAVDIDASKGVYNLPLTISSQNRNSTTEYLGISVLSKANLAVPDIQTDPREVVPGVPAILMVTVENTGKNDAKSVQVEILENKYIKEKLHGYIGTIEVDDDDTAMFELTVLPGAPKTLPIVMNVTYQDDTGEHFFIESKDLEVSSGFSGAGSRTSSTNRTRSSSSNMPVTALVILAVGIIIAIYYYKKYKKDKEQ